MRLSIIFILQKNYWQENSSKREGKKIFEKQLKTPYERLLEHPAVSEQDKKRAMKIKAALDIVALREKLEKACEELFSIATKKAGSS